MDRRAKKSWSDESFLDKCSEQTDMLCQLKDLAVCRNKANYQAENIKHSLVQEPPVEIAKNDLEDI